MGVGGYFLQNEHVGSAPALRHSCGAHHRTWYLECPVARLSPLPPHSLPEAWLIGVRVRRYLLVIGLPVSSRCW